MAAAADFNNNLPLEEIEHLLAENFENQVIDEEEWVLLNDLLHNNQQHEGGRNINIPHQNYHSTLTVGLRMNVGST